MSGKFLVTMILINAAITKTKYITYAPIKYEGHNAQGDGCHSHRLCSHGCDHKVFGALTVDHVEFQPLTIDYAHIYGSIWKNA